MKRRAPWRPRGSDRSNSTSTAASSSAPYHQTPTFYLDSNFALAVELPPTPADTPMGDESVDGDVVEWAAGMGMGFNLGLEVTETVEWKGKGTTDLSKRMLEERFDELVQKGKMVYATTEKKISDTEFLFPYDLLLCPALAAKPEIQVPILFSTASVSDTSGTVSELDMASPMSPTPGAGAVMEDMEAEPENTAPKFGEGSDIDYTPELVISQLNGNDPTLGNDWSDTADPMQRAAEDLLGWNHGSISGAGGTGSNTHWLVFNKFNIFRPQYLVLTTNSHLRQTSPLDITDIRVAWHLLHPSSSTSSDPSYTTSPPPASISTPFTTLSPPFSFSSFDPTYTDPDAAPPPKRWAMIYNCGPASGCSREHKHFQLFTHEDLGSLTDYIAGFGMEIDRFRIFRDTHQTAQLLNQQHPPTTNPDAARIREKKTRDLTVPFRFYYHQFSEAEKQASAIAASLGIPSAHGAGMPERIRDVYDDMLVKCREALGLTVEEEVGGEVPHNVILTDEELIVIPRRRAEWRGVSANAVGMMGVLWMSQVGKMEIWRKEGVRKVLMELGVPW
ncbi:hypothetical protein EX30DRAFT_344652 [Ascodesmis nigricans]|uniref:ATP adenylyltransferase C-terminal domain-containing protein n=1 Tax=Ascodesmis nigricans TaxID=341454 RepID=A0A4S2MIN5_9PEZI|nr:hypothetical protein EX30DRAFT_344652 [Ascodesmis nigricans]